jgi:hypothetical protein
VDFAFSGKFGRSFLQHVLAASADVNLCAEFEKALRHGFAESGTAASDEDALRAEKVGLEHEHLPQVEIEKIG